ncbi:MAG: NAD-dependent malic enzyme [Gemmatimonadota bacterium]
MRDGDRRPVGEELLHDPAWNKGTAFTEEERDRLHLRGLLPPRVFGIEEQEVRVLENFRRKPTDLEKYIYLIGLQDRNETLFYRVLIDRIEEMMPIVYTPTVGEACRTYGHLFRRARGLYVSAEDAGRVGEVLANWPREAAIACLTDGERILGLGDLGAHGMGIPVGKLSLYTACAGIPPSACLPLMLDVGTDNEELLGDPLYTGICRPRLRGAAYDALVEELLSGLESRFPGILVQFEDFARENAFRLLRRYRERLCAFNDDMQGTAAVALAGLLAAGRLRRRRLVDERVLFLGAGEAATGIAELLVAALVREGLEEQAARSRCWFVDSRGLVVAGREGLGAHKRPFAHEHEYLPDLERAVEALQPTVLIGVSGQPGTFTERVLRRMARANERPVVFALSNPTAKAECTAEEAYRWTDGRAVFAGGSPFAPVEWGGRTRVPGQGNNAYIFPGLGLGVLAVGSARVTEEMFLAAARCLAGLVDDATLDRGSVYPPLRRIREVSRTIAVAVAREAYAAGLARVPEPPDLEAHVRARMWEPEYRELV